MTQFIQVLSDDTPLTTEDNCIHSKIMSSFAPDRGLNQTSKHSNTNIWLKSVNSLEIPEFLT